VLQSVYAGKRTLDSYAGVAPGSILEELRGLGRELRGLRLLHINATPYGGGVSELLRSIVPLENDLGLSVDWKIIGGDEQFFEVTKHLHNALQGSPRDLTEKERAIFIATAEMNARALEDGYDVVIVHDPQPAALPELHGKGEAKWIWRCHIDSSSAHPGAWAFLRPYLAGYDAAVFTMRQFVPSDFPVPRIEIFPPAIDPLSPKNMQLPESIARHVLSWIGIDLERPFIAQVSRFDPWKDPLGVIAAYRLVQREIPDLQLALVGSMALDDPEGWEVYRQLEAAAREERQIHLFTNLTGVGNIEVNAFQSLADVVVQKSIREGFGLVVSEALWKGTPVVAGRAGGIPLQMSDGVGGLLVTTVDECASAILRLMQNPDEAGEMGKRGRERVRQEFLLPRLVRDELRLLRALVKGAAVAGAPPVSG
jgi:trehalose synthase